MAETNLLAHVLRTFPDHEPEKMYEAAIPLFRVGVSLKVLEEQHLPIAARFMLRAIAIGANTVRSLGYYLGLDESEVVGIGSELLRVGLITYRYEPQSYAGVRTLTLTSRGRSLVEQDQAVLAPRLAEAILHLNPITSAVEERERRGPDILRPQEVRAQGLFVIQTDSADPDTSEISLESVREALRESSFFKQREIVSIVQIHDPVIEYLRGIHVFVLRHRESRQIRFAAYYRYKYLPTESDALLRLHDGGKSVIPDDAKDLDPEFIIPQNFLPEQGTEALQEYVARRRRSQELSRKHERAVAKLDESAEIPPHVRKEIDQLRGMIERLTAERDNIAKQLEQQYAVEILEADDHRPLLENVLSEAETEIIIVSPWMSPYAVNHELCRLIAEATARGTNVKIGYGFGLNKGDRDRGRKLDNIRTVERMLREHRAYNGKRLEVVQLPDTHEKVLIWDRTAAVVTSFNWLSYSGGDEDHFRRETGFLTRHANSVSTLRKAILQIFEHANMPQESKQTA